MSDTILISRPMPKKKRKYARAVTVGIDQKTNISNANRADGIKKMVEEQMKISGYKRDEDPLLKEIKKIAHKYHAKMS
ncbi:hypothetical protein [Halalkalibacter nanhaiisediminis]|uniref:Uncharacterized protein n=1 Tax=Halalkalibacter nanhaiisediminis TaxID=688079 RepID=A0A562QHX1_9BACI|nr:hypothetical protein [Halalkalibacter nanhaiisediminis]TWI56339.1 hypothetical protein IQ10_02233 [Halalkalibacter nanhaiisediminis]